MTKKRLFIIALAALMLVAAAGLATAEELKTVVLTVPELNDFNVADAREALADTYGVRTVRADVIYGTITVTYVEEEADLFDLIDALAPIGLTVVESEER